MFNPFAAKKAPPASGNNFDPMQERVLAARAASTAATAGPRAAAGSQLSAGPASRDGPVLLRVMDDLAQAALKARNDFLAELNAADAQRREVHAAARARLEQELSQMAATATKLSDRLFFTARGVMGMVRRPQAKCCPRLAD